MDRGGFVVPMQICSLSAWEFINCNFQSNFLIWIISVIYGANFTKHVLECHSEGTMSQILYLGRSFILGNIEN